MGIPENIDALLVKFDITQEALARVAGVAPSTVTRWRNGSQIRRGNLSRICDCFGLEPDDLLSDSSGLAAKEHGRAPRDDDERELLELWRSVEDGARAELLGHARYLAACRPRLQPGRAGSGKQPGHMKGAGDVRKKG